MESFSLNINAVTPTEVIEETEVEQEVGQKSIGEPIGEPAKPQEEAKELTFAEKLTAMRARLAGK